MVPTGQPEVDVCPADGMALWAGSQKKKSWASVGCWAVPVYVTMVMGSGGETGAEKKKRKS